ncbi:MAG: type secretion system protein [Pseudomonadota bacterium]
MVMNKFSKIIAAYAFLVSTNSIFYPAFAQQTPSPLRPNEPVTLNFVNAEIESVVRAIASITGRNVVIDPRVKGQINLSTEKPVSPAVALNQFAAALRLQGFALVESGGLYKVVPEADAKMQVGAVNAGPVTALPGAAVAGNQIVTQIFSLKHENPNNLVPILRPLISPNHTINVNPGTNSLVITDYNDNLQRIGRIIAALDVSNATDIEIIPLKHAVATDLAAMVQRLTEGGSGAAALGQGQSDTAFKTSIIAEPRSNALVVRSANPARLALVRSIAQKLDRPTSANASGNIHVVYLKNADAVQLAATLRAAMAADGGSTGSTPTGLTSMGSTGSVARPATSTATSSGLTGSNPLSGASNTNLGSNNQASTGGQIQADPATNSLIITAPEPIYRQMRAVIDQLDMRRAQVFVESLIAEVNADKAAEFGIQWQGPLGGQNSSTIGLLGTNFGTAGKNIINLAVGAASGTVAPAKGLNFGAVNDKSGVYVLGFLARFLEENGEGNVLSTPNLLTLDNEEAKIIIGQNVPFVTGQFTNTGGNNNGSVNPFQTFERKDVGLTLRVKPQISENGTVKLSIYQEVSNVLASSVNSTTGLITNKRSIESNVLVEDGQIVVLGGLLQDEYSGNTEQVPGLGNVPIIGNLFKNQSRGRKKTNLMVFLRPVVVRDARQTEALAQDRYDMMRGLQQQAQPAPSQVLGINEAPVLPATLQGGLRGAVQPHPNPPNPTPATPATGTR